jgi:hypothetical protein
VCWRRWATGEWIDEGSDLKSQKPWLPLFNYFLLTYCWLQNTAIYRFWSHRDIVVERCTKGRTAKIATNNSREQQRRMTKFILFNFQFPSIKITLTAKEEDDGSPGHVTGRRTTWRPFEIRSEKDERERKWTDYGGEILRERNWMWMEIAHDSEWCFNLGHSI